MSNDLELRLLKEIEELKREIKSLKGESESNIPIYSFSKINYSQLKSLVELEKELNREKFNSWFSNKIDISTDDDIFFKNLILENQDLINDYNEEDLKVNFIAPLLSRVKFKSFEKKFRDFYELPLRYETDRFIFSGTGDFVVSKGLVTSEKPLFFIQEFKKGQTDSYPEPQLLAELISAVELNSYQNIKGAYIVGAIWNFVILERIERHKYIYYVSQNFDSTKIEDLKNIYKNLLYVKNEIMELIER